jgi:hypothetical protein
LQPSPRSLDLGDVRRAFSAGLGLSLVLLGALAEARADELSDLEKAYAAYAARKYVDAEERLRTLLNPTSGTLKDPDRVADARMYLGAVLLAEGRRNDALAVFQRLLLDKEDYQPDPLRIPLEALDALIDVRSQIREKVRALQVERARQQQDEQAKLEAEKQRAAARIAMLEKLAGEEIVIERNSRWIAVLPFGIGQFQNRQDPVGWTFLVAESVLGAGSVVSAALTLYNETNARDALARNDTAQAMGYNERARTAWWANVAFFGGFAATAVAGVVHAQATFLPERVQVRRRALPPLSFAPVVGPGGVGFVVKF